METVNLITCYDEIQAGILKAKLEENGISCFLTNEHSNRMMPYLSGGLNSGVRVMVHKADAAKALEILGDDFDTNKSPENCPECGSNDIRFGKGKSNAQFFTTLIMFILSSLPFGNIKAHYYCGACGNVFLADNSRT